MFTNIRKYAVLTLLLIVSICANVRQDAYAAGNYTQPFVTISSYEIDGKAVVPGQEFELTVKIKNTSDVNRIGSIIATISSDGDYIQPIYGQSDQFFVDGIKKDSSKDVTLKLQASKNIEATTVKLVFTFVYADGESKKNVNEATLYLPVSTTGALSISEVSVPDQAIAGTKTRISANYENTGADVLSNVVLHVTGSGLSDEIEQKIESVAGGEKGFAEAYPDFELTGEQTIGISFTYEDTDGVTHESEIQNYTIKVSSNSNSQTVGTSSSGTGIKEAVSTTIVPLFLIVAIIALMIVIIIVYRKSKR